MTAPQVHKWARRDPGTPAPVGNAAITAAFLRLFAVQGSWNYETMLGNGIAFSMKPLLKDLPEDRYHTAMARQARYFNAHPYLAGVAVGSLARAELDGENPARIERFRTALCGPLGSVGDQLVWAGWLPLCSLIALTAFALGAGPLAVVCIFLGVYNVGHVALRAWGLRVGLRSGMRVAPALANPVFQGVAGCSGTNFSGAGRTDSSARIAAHHWTRTRSRRWRSSRRGDRCGHSCSFWRACNGLARRARSAGDFCPLLGGTLMAERTVTIVNKNGVHARPAAEIVKTAGKFTSNVTIVRDDLEVNGKSIMGVMMLAAECGSEIILRATGPDADAAIDALAQLVATKFGER